MAFAQYDVCLSLSFAPYDVCLSCHLIYVYDIWLSRHMLNMMFVWHCHLLHMTFGHHAIWSTYMIFGYQGICSIWCLFVIIICSIWHLVIMPIDLRIWYLVIKVYAQYDVCLSLSFALYEIWSPWHLLCMIFGYHGICSIWCLVVIVLGSIWYLVIMALGSIWHLLKMKTNCNGKCSFTPYVIWASRHLL